METAKSFLFFIGVLENKWNKKGLHVTQCIFFSNFRYFCIKFRRNSARWRKNGVVPDATAKQKHRNFENQKTLFAVAKK